MEIFSYKYFNKIYQIIIKLITSGNNIVSFKNRNDTCIISVNNKEKEIKNVHNNIQYGSISPYTLYYLIKNNIENNTLKIIH